MADRLILEESYEQSHEQSYEQTRGGTPSPQPGASPKRPLSAASSRQSRGGSRPGSAASLRRPLSAQGGGGVRDSYLGAPSTSFSSPSRDSLGLSSVSRPASSLGFARYSVDSISVEEFWERERERALELSTAIEADARRQDSINSKMDKLHRGTVERDARRMLAADEAKRREGEREEEARERRRRAFEKFVAAKRVEEAQRSSDFAAFRNSNRRAAAAYVTEKFEGERKELEHLTREALANKELYDAYNSSLAEGREAAERRQQALERQRQREEASRRREAEEEEKFRRERHEGRLVERFGMTLQTEQVRAATLMPQFGVPIVRDGHPGTVCIGGRRVTVKAERLTRGRIGEDSKGNKIRLGEEIKREHFVVQLIPEGRFVPELDAFHGPLRFRVRYADVKCIAKTNDLDETTYVAKGAMRRDPMKVTCVGDDGYVAEWLEGEVPDSNGEYCGMFTTDCIQDANFGVLDKLVIRGWVQQDIADVRKGGEWKEVVEDIDIEFLRNV